MSVGDLIETSEPLAGTGARRAITVLPERLSLAAIETDCVDPLSAVPTVTPDAWLFSVAAVKLKMRFLKCRSLVGWYDLLALASESFVALSSF
jgi:hypothetical protein